MTESSTAILRRMLDERGVEWRAYTDLTRGSMELFHSTYFDMPNGCKARADSIIDSDLVLLTFRTTPAQAIAATFGTGTCHKVLDFDGTAWICSEGGEHIGPRRWNYCPNCGKRIEVDE